MIEQEMMDQRQDGRVDFDFYIGKWNVHHQLLRERLKGSQEWEECAGVAVVHKVLDGLAAMSMKLRVERASGRVVGMTVRLFDPHSQQWSIYWDTVGLAVCNRRCLVRSRMGAASFITRIPSLARRSSFASSGLP